VYAFRRLQLNENRTRRTRLAQRELGLFLSDFNYFPPPVCAHILQTFFGRELSIQLAQTNCLQPSQSVRDYFPNHRLRHPTTLATCLNPDMSYANSTGHLMC
jgi:hypothetical protein